MSLPNHAAHRGMRPWLQACWASSWLCPRPHDDPRGPQPLLGVHVKWPGSRLSQQSPGGTRVPGHCLMVLSVCSPASCWAGCGWGGSSQCDVCGAPWSTGAPDPCRARVTVCGCPCLTAALMGQGGRSVGLEALRLLCSLGPMFKLGRCAGWLHGGTTAAQGQRAL